MRDALNNALCRVLPVCGAALLIGCNVDLSGLNQLLDPDPTYLSLPGRRVASGEYSNISVGGTDFAGAYVLGNKKVDGTSTLAITPFEGGSTCNAGPSDLGNYRNWQFGVRNTLGMTFPFMRTIDKVAYLHLVSPSCEELLPPLSSDGLPFWPPAQPLDSVPGYLTLERDGDLLLLEPWDRKQRTIARGLRQIQTSPGKFWSLERPQDDLEEGAFGLVVRNESFKVIGQIDDVQEFAFTTDAKERTAYVQNHELYVAMSPDLEPSGPIDTDVCRPRFPGGYRGRGISYFSPCESRTLNIYGSARLSDEGPGKSDRKYVLKPGAVSDPVIQYLEDRAVVFEATTDGADPETITLWGGFLGEELERVGDAPYQDRVLRISSVKDEFQVLTDVVDNIGRLVRWKPGSEVREVATGVRECHGRICLVNFDGETGDAVFISSGGSVRAIASRVPRGSINAEEVGLAVVADYDSEAGVGTLFVGTPEGKDLEQVATDVPPFAHRFLQNLDAIAYLRDFNREDGTGAIGVRVLETADTFDTGVRASEFQEVGWPRPGLLYAVPRGDLQGIWFAALM